MQSDRLIIRPMEQEDRASFISGISDRSLRTAYGFPADLDRAAAHEIFDRFCGMGGAYSLVLAATGTMAGFMLDVPPELPAETASGLPGSGRTLAYAVFPRFRRQGYMEEALRMFIPSVKADYIHCGHFPDNEPSRKLLRKLGFRELGRHQAGTGTIVDEILCPVLLK